MAGNEAGRKAGDGSVRRRCLVTGGAGFIGSHLVDELVERGHEVVAVDNLSTGRRANLAGRQADARFTFAEADVCDLEAMTRLAAGIDWLFHLAGRADIVPSIQQPLLYHRTNVDGTASVLEAARAGGVKRLVYAASASCYGMAERFPTPETHPIRPEYPYALSKYLGEELVLHWGKVYGMSTVSLRLFNAYGPRSRTTGAYGAVFGVFLAQKLAGRPFTIVGDGTQTRDFTYVGDIARAFVAAAGSEIGGAFNIGCGGTYSVNRLIDLLGGERVHLPKRPGEPDCTFADIAKFRAATGWRPEVGFDEGVRIMVENIDHWRDAPVWTPDSIAEATRDWFRYLGD